MQQATDIPLAEVECNDRARDAREFVTGYGNRRVAIALITVGLVRREYALIAFMLYTAGCGRTIEMAGDPHAPLSSASRGAPDASGALDAGRGDPDAGPSKLPATAACTSGDPFARLRCNPSALDGVSWGEVVTVQRGIGAPPQPAAGLIVAGSYQLVAETLYGEVPPDEGVDHVGDKVMRILSVDCDIANEEYKMASSVTEVQSTGAGNDCYRTVPQVPPLLDLTGWMVSKGPAIPDARQQVAYSATATTLTLFMVLPYEWFAKGSVLGSFTLLEEFALASSSAASIDAGAVIEPPTDAGAPGGRDPRCPPQPPKVGSDCTPDPAPLQCEYGGDAWTRCTTFLECELDVDGSFHFRSVDSKPCTPPNPPDCPATFAAASMFATPSDAGVPADHTADASLALDHYCNYPEGVCGCSYPGSNPSQGDCNWGCRNGGNVGKVAGTECPWPRPLAGDACQEGLECDYETTCGGSGTIGPSMICQNGHWATFGGLWHGCGS